MTVKACRATAAFRPILSRLFVVVVLYAAAICSLYYYYLLLYLYLYLCVSFETTP